VSATINATNFSNTFVTVFKACGPTIVDGDTARRFSLLELVPNLGRFMQAQRWHARKLLRLHNDAVETKCRLG